MELLARYLQATGFADDPYFHPELDAKARSRPCARRSIRRRAKSFAITSTACWPQPRSLRTKWLGEEWCDQPLTGSGGG